MPKSTLLGQVVQIPIKLAQDKQKFWIEFCNFAMRFSVYCLAFRFEFDTQNKSSENHLEYKKNWYAWFLIMGYM